MLGFLPWIARALIWLGSRVTVETLKRFAFGQAVKYAMQEMMELVAGQDAATTQQFYFKGPGVEEFH